MFLHCSIPGQQQRAKESFIAGDLIFRDFQSVNDA